MTCGKRIYLLPHGPKEFSTECPEGDGATFPAGWETLRHWVMAHLATGQPGRGEPGLYNVRTAARFRRHQQGDILLFVKDRQIVARGEVGMPLVERAIRFAGRDYGGYIVFDPGSLQVFDPPTDLRVVPKYAKGWPQVPELLREESHPSVAALIGDP